MNLFTFLADVFLKDAKNILKLSKILRKRPRELLQTFYKQPQKFAEDIGKLDAKSRKSFTAAIQNAQEEAGQGAETAILSSSWLSAGLWTPTTTGDVGDLTLTLKTGNSYTYPGVSAKVWNAMKKARGRNGSGAGSVFWTLYLRSYRGSVFGQLQAKVFKLAGVKSMSPKSLINFLKK